MPRLLMILIVVTGLSCFAGCGQENAAPTYLVTGTVSLDGEPLKEGSIVFDPSDGKGGSSAGGIENGTFEFESEPGPKLVRITASEETGEKDEYGAPVSRSLIPPQYNDDTTLEVTVKKDGSNDFEFELTTEQGDKIDNNKSGKSF